MINYYYYYYYSNRDDLLLPVWNIFSNPSRSSFMLTLGISRNSNSKIEGAVSMSTNNSDFVSRIPLMFCRCPSYTGIREWPILEICTAQLCKYLEIVSRY